MLSNYWHGDQPTYEGVEAYTEGDCWILAYAIHEITGLPIVVTGLWDDWDHVLIKVDDDTCLDIYGVRWNDTVLHSFGRRTPEITEVPAPASWQDYKDFLLEESFMGDNYYLRPTYDGGIRTARAVAKRLVAKHLDMPALVG